MTLSDKFVYLTHWEECVGIFSKITVEDDTLIAKVGEVHLVLPLSLEQSLRPLIGQRIAILRTDLVKKPYLFRVLSQEQSCKTKEEQRG